MVKKDYIDSEELEVIEELHMRIDALIKALDRKGVLKESEYLSELHKIYANLDKD